MLTPPVYPDFERAYLDVLGHLVDRFEYRNAPRGNSARERIGLSFQIADPRARLPYLAERKVNPVWHFAEALWYLGGRDDVEMLAYYAPHVRRFSRDGRTMGGSAYGSRMFNPATVGGTSPFDQVLELLRMERDSKRGLLPIFTADELAVADNPDMSCVAALHLLVREGRVHMVCYMRANDCDRGLLSDTFSFTMIQEFAAVQLGLQLGTYTHHIGSAHVGERDVPRIRRVLAEAELTTSKPRFPFPRMPASTSFSTVSELLMHEERLRTGRGRLRPQETTSLGFDPYWQQVLLLFEVHRQIRHCPADPVNENVLGALDPGLRWLVAHRWPTRMPDVGAPS
ncbi:thymidylate synthase [Streptomyces sp. NPDC050433]|uniref:thymidylate synthase n=1 Tax=Streptomyces sp. NPDC050433 TaxID=3365615 RepID=UPI0037B3852C